MDGHRIDPQLVKFRRQYFQLFDPDFLAWPPRALLRDAGLQKWLYQNLFDTEQSRLLPPERFQFRVLKLLVAKIEKAFENPDEDGISDSLMSRLSELFSSNLPSEITAAQQKSYVTFSCTPPSSSESSQDSPETSITLLERRNLISGSRTTGFRTWEAALHLGSFLLTTSGQAIIRDCSVFELGAGTGFLSILCAKCLGAKHVTTTDGDEGVVETLRENLFLNELDDGEKVITGALRWGRSLRGSWVEDVCEDWPYDVVLGADITYDKVAISALVVTFGMLFEMRPKVRVLISGAVRNVETFETFRHMCLRNEFQVEEIPFEPKPILEQEALFYAIAVPLRILSITAPP